MILMMWDVFNAITLAVLVYVVIPFWGAWFFHWLREKREIRKDRQRIDQIMAETEAQREHYRTPTNP